MAVFDPDKLFETLEKGFDDMEKGVTDKTRRFEMRMEKMRQKIEDNAEKMRERMEKKVGQVKLHRKEPSWFKIISRSFIFIMLMIMFGYIAVTFTQFLTEQQYQPKALNPAVEETAKPKEFKKL